MDQSTPRISRLFADRLADIADNDLGQPLAER